MYYLRPLSPLTGTDSDWYGTLKPNNDPTSVTLRCGPNATTSGTLAKIIDVKAGETVGFGVGEPHFRYGVSTPLSSSQLHFGSFS